MSRLKKLLLSSALAGLLVTTVAGNAQVAIVTGGWYTPNLNNQLTGAGLTVTEISDYTAASLAGFQAVIHYGNSFTDTTELSSYVSGGGRLILTPWSGLNYALPPDLQVFDNGGIAVYAHPYPEISVLNSHSLLNDVTLPTTGGFNVGFVAGIGFAPGATQIANWATWYDGTAFLGVRPFGAGEVIGINMHVITSDTAYAVIDQPWATQLFVNAVNGPGPVLTPVPEPSTYGLIGAAALVGVVLVRRKKAALRA